MLVIAASIEVPDGDSRSGAKGGWPMASALAQSAAPACASAGTDSRAGAAQEPNAGLLNGFEPGGDAQAGLPTGTLAALVGAARGAVDATRALCTGVEQIAEQWARLGGVSTAEDADGIVADIVVKLRLLEAQHVAALRAASAAKVGGIEAQGRLQRAIDDNQRKAIAVDADIARAEERLRAAELGVAAAKRELAGSRGFWRGLATGVTFGIYNPVKQKLDEANAYAALANEERGRIVERRATLRVYGHQLARAHALIGWLDALDAMLTNFQNVVTAAGNTLGRTRDDHLRATATRSTGAADFYRTRVADEMGALIAWLPELRSALARIGASVPAAHGAT